MIEEKFINEVNQVILDAYSQEIEHLRKRTNQILEKIIKIENQELFSKLSQHLTKFSLQEIKKVPQADFTQLIHILKTIIKLSSKVNE